MATIKIDLNKKVKAMKPMHGGGQPPLGGKDMTEPEKNVLLEICRKAAIIAEKVIFLLFFILKTSQN